MTPTTTDLPVMTQSQTPEPCVPLSELKKLIAQFQSLRNQAQDSQAYSATRDTAQARKAESYAGGQADAFNRSVRCAMALHDRYANSSEAAA